jgi:Pyruvate/2-oxoacid:ferredoxin oxidoreductase gamma subunit
MTETTIDATTAAAGLSVALAGSGGSGVMTAGTLLLSAAAKAGAYGLMVRTSGPQIRGGEAAALLRIAPRPVASLDDRFHLLLALDWQNVHRSPTRFHSGRPASSSATRPRVSRRRHSSPAAPGTSRCR